MGLIDGVTARMIAQGFATAVGTDIFHGAKAVIPPNGAGYYISLIATGGAGAVRSHDGKFPRPTCQVLVRHQSATLARSKARQLHDDLDGLYNLTLGGESYLSLEALQEPIDLQPEGGYARFAFNLSAMTNFP